MELQKTYAFTKSTYIFLLITGIVLTAFNLRPAITSLGPLIGMIQEDVGLAHWSAGLLMSLPLIVFAIMSPIVPNIASRISNEKTLLLGLISILVGIGIRSFPLTFFLYTGTLLAGVGIAIGNVLLPAIVKDKFPEKFGLMTSVYSTSMGLIASLASGVSVPLAEGLNLGWQGAQIVWGIPAAVGIVVWFFLQKFSQKNHHARQKYHSSTKSIWRSPLSWQIAIFMGFQSLLFYVTVSWLPEIVHSHGMSTETAGWMLSFSQLMGLPASFLIPVWAGRLRSQIWLAFILSMSAIVGYAGLLIGTSHSIIIISIIFIGIALGGSFPLALSYIGLRTRNASQAAALSGMAQSTGYILAAIGPLFIGYLYDYTHSWATPLISLIIICVIVMVFGMLSGRNKYV
ncbi:CynX/NimT family MFS transporter [Neobacillus kokaensis]|uniref:Transporter YycB n=1 Tax=Neobacillus kokaensis TaxID=2759023 RepID=A0ABQ3NCI1_9BACI|nr:MFS transporter [Neobacillus kokaensis]GHI01625.1 putative transporter YycB [Neobacillus kokaensis]